MVNTVAVQARETERTATERERNRERTLVWMAMASIGLLKHVESALSSSSTGVDAQCGVPGHRHPSGWAESRDQNRIIAMPINYNKVLNNECLLL